MKSRLPSLFLVVLLSLTLVRCGDDDGGGSGLTEQEQTLIEAEPQALKFPHAAEGDKKTLKVNLKNIGESELNIKTIELEDAESPFMLGGAHLVELGLEGLLTVPVGHSALVEVTYTAGVEIPPDNALVVESEASNAPRLEIPITVGQAATGLVIFPDPVNFGEVLGAETKVIPVSISNVGTSDAQITNAFLQMGGSDDFQIIDPPEYPVAVPSGEDLVLDLAYVPQGGGGDSGELVISFNDSGTPALTKIQVFGEEVGPEISISPPKLDFGWVAVDDKVTLDLTIHNMGQHVLKVSKVYLAPLTNEDIIIDNPPAGTLEIKPSDKSTLQITFAPTEFFPLTSDPIGGIVMESNDSDEGIVNTPIYANIDAPFIKLDPADKVDFGIVAQGWTIDRTLIVQNVGHAPLTVDLMEITGNTADFEFAFADDNEFQPAMQEGGEGLLSADQKAEVYLVFTNDGGASGVENAVLHIHSNDPITPDVYIDLSATRGGSPECKLAFAPGKLDFGIVAHGAEKTKAMNVINSGSGYCSWKTGIIRECTSFMGLMTTCTDSGSSSDLFMPLGMPIPMADGMPPGTAHPIQIHYVPPTSIPWIPIFEEYYAVLQVTYTEPYSVPGAYTEHKFPIAGANGQLQWNIHGSSGVADIAVLPSAIEFGLVTIGCYSQTICVKIYNAGTAPLQVTDIYTDGCGPEFNIKNFPALPVEINPSAYQEACVVYLPQDEGPDECFMKVDSSDMDTPTALVPLLGEGTWETENTDYFTQISGKKVDILFVVDESGSMCGEQDNLADNFEFLTELAAQWGNDYQLGITTTNVKDEDEVGKLFGEPRIMTKANVSAFAKNVTDVGCSGAGEQESGMEAGRRALSPPNANDTDISCNCGEDQPCGMCMETDMCVKGKCGGYNRGFLRPDAALEVVFVSDEEDQSPGSVPFYIDFFKSIKGFLNEDMFHAHAIVGDKNGGCTISSDEGADAGKRYIEVQEATGGVFGSICDESFAEVLEDIGSKAFGLQVQFFLSAQADSTPGNIKVWVDSGGGDQECTQGWDYDPATNAVLFDENGSCMPQPGDKIKIWYKMVCNTE